MLCDFIFWGHGPRAQLHYPCGGVNDEDMIYSVFVASNTFGYDWRCDVTQALDEIETHFLRL